MVFLLHISAAHTGLTSFVSPANPGKAEGGKKNEEKHTAESRREGKRVGIPLGGLERIWSFK